MTNNVQIIASARNWIEQSAIDQLHRTAQLEGIERAVGLPDLHAGRGIPIGAAFWSSTHAHPHLIGNDIGCGMALWQTDINAGKFKLDRAVKKLTGLDQPWAGNQISALEQAGLPLHLAGEALGTIGGGNHFAEFQKVEAIIDDERFTQMGLDKSLLFLLVHSGSRGLGHAVQEDHTRRFNAEGLNIASDAFAHYLTRHDQAMTWARLNRDIIANRFLAKLGADAELKLDIFHNSLTRHRDGWLHRKGAAPADKGPIVIPGSRGSMTYLVCPRPENADVALHSLAHGAGRKWPRSSAKARLGRKVTLAELERTALGGRVLCEDNQLIFEEAPQAYKDIETVVSDLEEAGLITVIAVLRPVITYKTRRK
ncbi:hypothetical protein EH31_10785 [Erythrobacter longus]|uniref:3'-phosphate/5'-hydroxy nucleic acid ligase n=1 Tax=Erythrobacter longus TaxID=1044 RepID=A0A074MAY5_ERYLO|nr:RNA ligase RtcB family protein [Erythrobacter longus]KEO90564.1 hypothetical protein EH31_10785 [Erythrobacter longus]